MTTPETCAIDPAASRRDKPVRVLSLDGGGIRGILSGSLLVALEEELQRQSADPDTRLADHFDLIAGTSTGGILGAGLLTPDAGGRPRYTAAELVDFYLRRGGDIFDRGLWQRIKSAGGLLDEQYDAGALDDALRDYFGDTRLKDLLRPCIITAYDIERRHLHLFRQHRAAQDEGWDFAVRDVARATSAAPTYFQPPLVTSAAGDDYALVDGGLFANNPALIAYTEAGQIALPGRCPQATTEDVVLVSLGTAPAGEAERKPYPWRDARDWGAVGWASAVIDILMSAAEDTTSYHLQRMYSCLPPDQQKHYRRLTPVLGDADIAMDNASDENLGRLRAAGAASVAREQQQLGEIAALLLAVG